MPKETLPILVEADPPMPTIEIRDDKFREIKFARSGGPGGQNVNKVNSKAQLWWDFESVLYLTGEQKATIREKLSNYIKGGRLFMEDQQTRDQKQNKENVIRRMENLVNYVLIPQKERKPTEPTEGSEMRRLEGKKKLAKKKQERCRRDFE